MRIRLLTRADISAVSQIDNAWDKTVFADCFSVDYYGWVLELNWGVNTEIVGFIIILLHASIHEAQLMNIAIHPDYQRRGLASRLLQQAIDFAKAKQIKQLLLEVRVSNSAAIEFYKKWGGKQIAVREGYYPSAQGREDALIFSLFLEKPDCQP